MSPNQAILAAAGITIRTAPTVEDLPDLLARQAARCIPDMSLPDDETDLQVVDPDDLLEQVAVAGRRHPRPARRRDIGARAMDSLGSLLERPWRPAPAVRQRARRHPLRWARAHARWALPVVVALPLLAIEWGRAL